MMAKRNRGLSIDNLFFYLISLLVYSSCVSVATGMVTLSPTSVAPVCRVGDPLELTCSSSGNFSRWTFSVGNEQGVPQEYRRNINTQDGSQQMSMINVNSTTFTFMRTSSQGMLPLVSTLVIDSVNRYLNGTEVHCLDLATTITASTTIRLLDMSPFEVGPIVVTSEEFGVNNVTVTVEWTQLEGATYQLIIVPQIPIPMTSTGESSIQLILPYNNNYNLSVKSALPCQHQAQSHILLFYANCGYPLLSADESKLNVAYSGLPIQGATISFTCPTDLVLNGSNTATCMGNGEWEPNPQEVVCIEVVNCEHPVIDELVGVVGYDENDLPTEQGVTINLTCPPAMSITGQNSITCMENGVWEPEPTSILCKEGPDNGTSTTVIIVAISVSLVISILITISTCVIVILVNSKRKGKRPSSCNVVLSSVPQRNDRSSNNNDLPNLQDEPDYSVLQRSQDHLGSQKPTSVTRMDEGNTSNVPDVLHGLYADVVVTPKKKHPPILSAPDLDNSRVAYTQIEHKLDTDKADIPESDQAHSADLQINLDSLLIQLKGKVSSKWYQFGEAAGIDKRVLDNYVKNCSPDECIVEMFDYWLRSYKGKMTWRVVAAILRSINLQQLAFDIEQVYVTGKLPVESESGDIPQSFSVCKPGAKVSSEIEVPPPIPPKLLEHDIWAPLDQGGQTNNEPADKLPPRPPKTKSSIIMTAGPSAPARPPKPPYM